MTFSSALDWQQHLAEVKAPTLHFVTPDPTLPSVLFSAAEKLGLSLCVLDGTKLVSKDAVMLEVANAMAFPAYFGRNWDAVHDLLTDLSWKKGRGTILLVTDIDSFRRSAFREFVTFIRVVSSALSHRAAVGRQGSAATSGPLFHVVLSGSPLSSEVVVHESTQTLCIHAEV